MNGDDSINVSDLSAVKLHFGEYSELPEFDPTNDIDAHGSIDITDVSIVKGAFGTSSISYPQWVK